MVFGGAVGAVGVSVPGGRDGLAGGLVLSGRFLALLDFFEIRAESFDGGR
jgi:hypothetical protein